ncbi:uncharacterized protein BX664DRAFT_341919 [Halteromyces radiatus]|uniref:uncharacterized protein n=1 Tax=Halteromyces radiatus TaxID=101107 RepID=UPI00221F1FD6|nr:uncharacterized protein BX664DRAFT_341919 [Halteromyces radiatus]KAI8079969.1 hypothetical protein BX664DRAFT_341919 [Halteromyces radiatus]
MTCRIYSLFCFIFLGILASSVEGFYRERDGNCVWPRINDLVDIQGMPITPGSSYTLKALRHGLVLGQHGIFGEARGVFLDRVNSTSSITVIPQITGGSWDIRLADANPPLYLNDVFDTLMFDTRRGILGYLPNKGANNFNIGRQQLASRTEYGETVYSCYQYLMATLKGCKQCEIDKRNPELTYFTLTKVGN